MKQRSDRREVGWGGLFNALRRREITQNPSRSQGLWALGNFFYPDLLHLYDTGLL